MRFLSIFLLLIGFTLLPAKSITFSHDPQKITILKNGSFDQIEYSGMVNLSSLDADLGAPDLPFYVHRVVLMPGQTIQSFQISDLQQDELKGTFNILPRQEPWSEYGKHDFTPANPEIYDASNPYPKAVVQFLGVQHFNGLPVAHFAVWPFQYLPKQKKILFTRRVTIHFTTKASSRPGIQPLLQEDQEAAQKLLETGKMNELSKAPPLPPGTDSIDPDLLSSGLIDRYVIITTEALKDALQPLADWKIRRGVPTVIKTLSWVRQNFRGIDDAERMRNFIRWSYRKRGTRYVLLAGDTEVIPTRIIHTGDFTFAADYYFADLDGSWNANQNDTFGQAKDEVEAYPEVYVARIPVASAAEVQHFIAKLFRYEKLDSVKTPNYPTNVLYLAANLQKVNDGRDLIMKNIDPQINSSFSRTLLTQSKDIGSDVNVPLRELNKGYGFIFSEGHGIYYTYKPGERGSDLYNYHLAQLTTPDPPIWYMASCYTNDITKRCFGEDYILNPHGGGVAYIGNTAWEYPFSGIYLEREFFNLAFNKKYFHLSEAHYLSRLPYINYLNFEGPSRIIVFSTLVLGDPEMPIWTDKPKDFKISKEFVRLHQQRYLNITVQNADSASNAVNQATVVLYKKDVIYQIKRTDASGLAQFNVTGVNTDSVFLTVWAHNYRPLESMVNLIPDNGIAARLTGFHFVQTQGNGNNQSEPGEAFDLYLTWENTGSQPISSETAITVHTVSSLYALKDTVFTLDEDLLPGKSVTTGPFKLAIGTNIQADTTLRVPVALSTPADEVISDQIEFSVFVPRLIVANQEFATLAGESGKTEENETLVRPHIQNIGRGMATGIQARIFSNDSLVNILTPTISMDRLAPGEIKAFQDDFSLRINEPVDSVRLTLVLSNQSGLEWTFPIDFVPPTPPAALSFRTKDENGIVLSWPPADDPDVLGYYIFRTDNLNHPFVRITQTPVHLAGYFVDGDINSEQSYYYALATVDSSGNMSAFSDTIHAWASLPYQQGFPIRPNVKAIGSEVSGVTCFDFDGDGKKELIASGGNGQLFMYDASGKLLFHSPDLEGDLTFPAVGNVTGSEQKEIVVSSFKEGQPENNVYVIDSQTGSVLAQYDLQYNAPSPVVLADLDGDGYDEILVLTHGANAPQPPKESRLFILKDSSGVLTHFKNWPQDGYAFEGDLLSLGNMAVADLDGSGELSVIVPTFHSKLFCFKPDSAPQPKWVKTLSGYLMSPLSVADLNGDGQMEMVVPSVRSDLLYVLNSIGEPLPGWENGKPCKVTDPYGHSSPAVIGNVDEDQSLEIIYVGRDSIYIFKADGSPEPGWPKAFYNGDGFYDSDRENLAPYNSPVLGDVNQDGIQDLVFLDTDGFIHAFSTKDGQEIAGFPIFTNNDRVNAQSPVLDDIDGDGDLDILTVNHEGVLMVWDAPEKYSESTFLYWNQPLANVRHTGVIDTLHLNVVSGMAVDNQPELPAQFFLKPNYPNPFNPQTTIEFGLKEPAFVEITVYNVLGQKIITLVNNRLLGSGVYHKIWQGKNQSGIEQASGIYFLRLTVRDRQNKQILFSKTGKMIKLK